MRTRRSFVSLLDSPRQCVYGRLVGRSFASEERKALRLKAKEAKVSQFLRTVDNVKKRSLEAMGVAGLVVILGLGALLLKKRLDGGSEYVVFEKAINVLSEVCLLHSCFCCFDSLL